MKEKQSKCSVKIYFFYDPPLMDYIYRIYDGLIHSLHWFKDIYIEKIFSKKYPNNIFDWLQGENILRKKSN